MTVNIQNVLAYYTRKGVFNYPPIIHPNEILLELLKTDAGSHNIKGVGSLGGPIEYFYECGSGILTMIEKQAVMIQDKTIIPTAFGAINDGLTNGCKVQVLDTDHSTVLFDVTGGFNLKTNCDFSHITPPTTSTDPGAGDDLLSFLWDMAAPIPLTPGQRYQLTVQDDLSALTHFHWILHGKKLDATKSA